MNLKPKTYSFAKALKYRRKNLKSGFTLVELLVVMAILGILTVVTLGNFRTSQIKARDAQRKSDLRQISNALEAYYNDYAGYPPQSVTGGMIKACSCGAPSPLDCAWMDPGEREFCDKNNTVYMSMVPGDPLSDPSHSYCYYSEGNLYRLYAILENENDPEILGSSATKSCGADYNFGVSSANTKP